MKVLNPELRVDEIDDFVVVAAAGDSKDSGKYLAQSLHANVVIDA